MELNKIYNENCLDTMSRMPNKFIDLTVTSPPYDNLRTYNGYSFDFESIAKELYRVTKPGGVVVWIVGDATIKGCETGTSFKQALYFKDLGFNLHDTMIWNKGGFTGVGALVSRYGPVFEYMFILTKGKLKAFNPLIDKLNKHQSGNFDKIKRDKDGSMRDKGKKAARRKYGQRFNIWDAPPCCSAKDRNGHPAPFPEKLIQDHIISWSNEDDLVYDPFGGSGTTAKMANKLNRNWILSEISQEYCTIAEVRIQSQRLTPKPLTLQF
jgi:DNA modification methylase